ncbi:hypothetical protein D3C84_1254180 [compost metagenome]
MMVMTGPITNRLVVALVGITISLSSSLSASAIGCSSPPGPTRFGPTRIWIQPISLRSHKVR